MNPSKPDSPENDPSWTVYVEDDDKGRPDNEEISEETLIVCEVDMQPPIAKKL